MNRPQGPPAIGVDARKARDFGIGVYIRELVGAMARNPRSQRHRFVLFARREDRGLFAELPENFSVAEENARGYSLAELTRMPARVRRHRLKLFHATHYVLPPMLGAPAVVTIHDIIHLLYPQFLPGRAARLYARRMISRSLHRARRVIAVSANTRDDLMSRFRVPGSRIEVVPNGVSRRFRADLPHGEADRVASLHGLPRPYALFVGGEKPHKNLPNVIRAFAQAAHGGPSRLKLVVAGPRSEPRARTEELVASLGLGDSVLLLGPVAEEELPGLYAGALFLLHPALYEGFGLPAVEAMACGTPVLTSSTSALRETAGEAAYRVDPLDVGAIAQGIRILASDAGVRSRLRELGLERAKQFSWEKAADRTLEIYEEALLR
jgi:glycosyltransferase involved in cell wall biosynthesis